MRLVSINNVLEGDVLAKTIYDSSGRVLLVKGAILTKGMIINLIKYEITEIYCSAIGYPTESKEVLYSKVKAQIAEELKTATKLINQSLISTDELLDIVDGIVEELITGHDIIIDLVDLHGYDNFTFSHSLNVLLLSIVTGLSMGYPKSKLKMLGIGAMLHDIGKMLIPIEILNKPDILTDEEFEIIKKHAINGYNRSKVFDILDVNGRTIILHHHERVDGSGYPDGQRGNEIHEFARIVAVCDVFDAITNARPYRRRWSPKEGIEYLFSSCGTHLDFDIVKKFSECIALYPLGSSVRLSNKTVGFVVENRINPNRPIVLANNSIVDLNKELNITIEDIIL
ncbi:HD-GYP domain-containing protein [Desulfitobacterium sp. AusDCA]|uniref:HD-GYP domain-containing protein n=1 Tax=Desulfitobacterium sp. AusDCA TaxID=3240383 RepID=UPI003DA79B8F